MDLLSCIHLQRHLSNMWLVGAIANDIFCHMNLTDEMHHLHTIPALIDAPPGIIVEVSSTRTSDASSAITGHKSDGASIASSAAASSCSWIVPIPGVDAPGIPECYHEGHKQAKMDNWMEDKTSNLRKQCESCKTRGLFYCIQCHKYFCKDGSISSGKPRFCMYNHICVSFQQTFWAGKEFIKEYAGWLASQKDQ
jgi:hypothetical protein